MKVRFVIPWYGKEIPGGAESECRRTAENLRRSSVDVEVLTTCAKDAYDWENHHKPGNYEINGVRVKRFKVDKRDVDSFNQINYKLMNNISISKVEEEVFIGEMINSKALYDYIAKNNDGYYFFIPYMFGTTFYGSSIHPHRSYLIPCLHNESYAYLNIYKEMFKKVKGVVFHVRSEKELAKRIYDLSDNDNENLKILGEGVDSDFNYDSNRFRKKYKIDNDFILYAGRKDAGKNIFLLFDYFSKYKEINNSNLKLVIIGSGDLKIPKKLKHDVIDLGYVSKQDKYDAFSASIAHCQPSTNESFSLTIMESWLCETPVLVHEDCEVTKDHCLDSNGGLFFKDMYEFAEALNYLIENPKIAGNLGKNGKSYVQKNYSWDKIVRRYQNLINQNEN